MARIVSQSLAAFAVVVLTVITLGAIITTPTATALAAAPALA